MLKKNLKIMILVYSFLSIALSANAASAEIATIDFTGLDNKAGLGTTETRVLAETISKIFQELPGDRFQLTAVSNENPQHCDDSCQVDMALARESTWLLSASVSPFGDGYVTTLNLYEVDSGQLYGSSNTKPIPSLEELLEATENVALELRDKLHPMQRPITPSTPQKKTPMQEPVVTDQSSVIGTLTIVTEPPGAQVFISRYEHEKGTLAGISPVNKQLLPLNYWITVKLKDHKTALHKVTLDPSENEMLNVKMIRIYPANPYKKAGHVLFWSGLSVELIGLISLYNAQDSANDYHQALNSSDKQSARNWTGVMWGSFGLGTALMTCGIVSWVKSPGDKSYFEHNNKHTQAWLSPTGDGGMTLSLRRRF